MLGIRHCQGVAIDLWQGDIKLFVNDLAVLLPAVEPAKINSTIKDLIHNADVKNARHAAVEVGKDVIQHGGKLFGELKQQLTQPPKALRRITFVMPDLEAYYAFQEALFAAFPE